MADKFISIPIKKYELEEIDEDLLKLQLFFITIGVNPNNTNFSKEAIDDATPSLSNKPLLAYIKDKGTDTQDFTSHEVEIVEDENGDYFLNYLEQPVGIIPESNNFHYEEMDGITYGVIDVYVWKEYCSEAVEILQKNEDEGQNISMEIKVKESEEKGVIEDITKFTYSGITFLSNTKGTGIKGAKADIVNFELSEDKKEEFFVKVKELNERLYAKTLEKSNSNINKKIKEGLNMKLTKKQVAEKFSLTAEQLVDELERVLELAKYSRIDWWGDTYECEKYYLIDLDDTFVFARDCEQSIYVKIPFSKNGDDVSFDFDKVSRIKFSPVDWIGSTPENEIDTDDMMDFVSKEQEDLKTFYIAKANGKIAETIKTKDEEFTLKETALNTSISEKDTTISDLTEKFNKVSEDIKLLESYKLQKETDEKLQVFDEYAEELSEDEIKPIKDKISEFSIETITKELKVLYADKNHKPNSKKNYLPKHNNIGIENFSLNDNDSNELEPKNLWAKLEENIKK